MADLSSTQAKEFVRQATLKRVDAEGRLRKAFKIFDADNSGYLTADEMTKILTRLTGREYDTDGNGKLSVEEAQEFIADFDVDEDGRLSIDEFITAIVSLSGGDINDDGEIDDTEMTFGAEKAADALDAAVAAEAEAAPAAE